MLHARLEQWIKTKSHKGIARQSAEWLEGHISDCIRVDGVHYWLPEVLITIPDILTIELNEQVNVVFNTMDTSELLDRLNTEYENNWEYHAEQVRINRATKQKEIAIASAKEQTRNNYRTMIAMHEKEIERRQNIIDHLKTTLSL